MLKVDLPFWFQLLELYLIDDFRPLQRKAMYELFVAKLIGQNHIEGQEDRIRDYFSDFVIYRSSAVLEDAANLLSFVNTAKRVIGHTITNEEIKQWSQQLMDVLEAEYTASVDPGRKVWLLVLKANHTFHFSEVEYADQRFRALLEDLKKTIPHLNDARFFPFDVLAKLLNQIIEILLKLDAETELVIEFEEFAQQIDDQIGKRYGEQDAGNRLKNRAIQYYQAERYIQALEAFHRLKTKWSSADSPKGIVLTALLIAKCYKALNLDYASKYYALAAAHIVAQSDEVELQKYLPQALSVAADACYASGAWLSFVDILDMSILTHRVITKDFDLYSEDKQHLGIVFYPAVILYVARRFNLDNQHLFTFRFNRWGYIYGEINEVSEIASKRFDEFNEVNLMETLGNQINDKVFSDFGPKRSAHSHLQCIKLVLSEFSRA